MDVMFDEQHGMHQDLCPLVSNVFYYGELHCFHLKIVQLDSIPRSRLSVQPKPLRKTVTTFT